MTAGATAPAEPGSYLLLLQAQRTETLRVGSLGLLTVTPGWYVYAGSALGPGGLRGRLAHHLRAVTRPHWHIDYLRTVAAVVDVYWVAGQGNLEHIWAAWLAVQPGASVPWPRFGASDCRCTAHLVRFEDRPVLVPPALPAPVAGVKPGP